MRKQIGEGETVRDRAQTANTNEKGQKILLIFAGTTQTQPQRAGELVNTKCKQHNFEVPNKLMAPSKFDAKIYISRGGTHARGRGRRRRWVGRKKPVASFYGVHKSKVTFICSWGLDQKILAEKMTGFSRNSNFLLT